MPQPAAPVKPQADEARYQGFNVVNNNDRNIICIYNLIDDKSCVYIYCLYCSRCVDDIMRCNHISQIIYLSNFIGIYNNRSILF